MGNVSALASTAARTEWTLAQQPAAPARCIKQPCLLCLLCLLYHAPAW
ncbi:hypothetical protein [Pendulispora albinea]|uniref:Uncharacterized protein n=1 Tax=Pendulispora albinea TaxID=2741071 RepID=A0ABZ2LZ83_9BACT